MAINSVPVNPCPYLGLANDPDTCYAFPVTRRTRGFVPHRCYATSPPTRIDFEQQDNICLRSRHEECSKYTEAQSSNRMGLKETSTDIG